MKISNRRAFHDYHILETYEAGIHLTGPEVKSVKGGRLSLEGSFIKIIGSEVYLINAQIFPYPYASPPAGGEGYDSKRSRKLLLHKKEIIALKTKITQQALTLVPLECYIAHGFVKLKISLAKGKKVYEKREKLKKRALEIDIKRELRGK